MQPWVYFLISGAFLFLIMRGGCGAHVMGHGHHHHSGDDEPTGPRGSVPAAGATQARDPVCGMTIDVGTAKTSVHQGKVVYFCSDNCRSKFETSPEAYAIPAT